MIATYYIINPLEDTWRQLEKRKILVVATLIHLYMRNYCEVKEENIAPEHMPCLVSV